MAENVMRSPEAREPGRIEKPCVAVIADGNSSSLVTPDRWNLHRDVASAHPKGKGT